MSSNPFEVYARLVRRLQFQDKKAKQSPRTTTKEKKDGSKKL